ncbi:MAG TPA: hypothetical protein VHQ39_12750 [Dongiaceae bacterium]|jgi:hypothetical protein|nr:hypothetical protein [Dongiaceae bacterium]
MKSFDRRARSARVATHGPRTIGLMQLFASSLLCYGVSRFGEHPYLLLGSLVFSIVFTAIGAWNLADRS